MGISVKLGFTGDLEGRILLDMSERTALFIAGAMNSETLTAFDELVKGSLEELARVIAGNTAGKLKGLGLKINCAQPTFFAGNYVETTSLASVEPLVIPFELE
jgi:chemotaxis protein CheX